MNESSTPTTPISKTGQSRTVRLSAEDWQQVAPMAEAFGLTQDATLHVTVLITAALFKPPSQ